MKITCLLIVCCIWCGCDPYRFTLMSNESLHCRIYSEPNTVEPHQNYVEMFSGSSLAIHYPDATQYRIVLPLQCIKGEGVDILLRPRIEERIIDSGLVLSLTQHGSVIRYQDSILAAIKNTPFRENGSTVINIYNDDDLLRVAVGCDTLQLYPMKRRSSDKIGLVVKGESHIKVAAPAWFDLERD